MIDLQPHVRKSMNDYSGNRDFSTAARAAAERLFAMIQKAPSPSVLKAEMTAQEFGFDSHGQAFWQGQALPLAVDRGEARKLAAALRDIVPAPAKK